MDYICGECGEPLKPTSKSKKKYKCKCWTTKAKDIPPMAEIIAVMSERMKQEHTFH